VAERAPGGINPIASITAITAHVPVPQGERSTSASAKIVTFFSRRRSAQEDR